MRNALVVGLVALLVASGGCLGGVADGDRTATTTDRPGSTSAATAPTATSTASTAGNATTATATTDAVGHSTDRGTTYLYVDRLANGSEASTYAEDERVRFENLSAAKKDGFLDALDEGGQTESPVGWERDRSNPELVYYDGTWYRILVAIR